RRDRLAAPGRTDSPIVSASLSLSFIYDRAAALKQLEQRIGLLLWSLRRLSGEPGAAGALPKAGGGRDKASQFQSYFLLTHAGVGLFVAVLGVNSRCVLIVVHMTSRVTVVSRRPVVVSNRP